MGRTVAGSRKASVTPHCPLRHEATRLAPPPSDRPTLRGRGPTLTVAQAEQLKGLDGRLLALGREGLPREQRAEPWDQIHLGADALAQLGRKRRHQLAERAR